MRWLVCAGRMDGLTAPAVPEASRQSDDDAWVLLAEDDANLRNLLVLTVNEVTGLPVKAACDGREALDLLAQSGPPALVLTDLMMPIVDGYGLLEAVRTSYSDMPVVAMSAADSRARALASGFDAYLVKPFELEELCATLARWVAVD